MPKFGTMQRRLIFLLLGMPVHASSQLMELVNAYLTVAPGTTLRLASPLTWQMAPGAIVANDGLIDLGSNAEIIEQPGAPFIGTGIELATWALTLPLAGDEPGNLGLTLTTSYSGGGLVVERGHLPRYSDNGTPSIGRWYRVSTPFSTTATLDALLNYDMTEIGGVLPSGLALLYGPGPGGPWEPSPTVGDEPQQSLSASVPAPEVFITAFDLDAALSAPEASRAGWRCWPTVFANGVSLANDSGEVLHEVHLHDASGRIVHQARFADAGHSVRLQFNSLSAGAYALVINGGETVFKLVKP